MENVIASLSGFVSHETFLLYFIFRILTLGSWDTNHCREKTIPHNKHILYLLVGQLFQLLQECTIDLTYSLLCPLGSDHIIYSPEVLQILFSCLPLPRFVSHEPFQLYLNFWILLFGSWDTNQCGGFVCHKPFQLYLIF